MKRYIIAESSEDIYVYDRRKRKGYKHIDSELISINVDNEFIFSKVVVYVDKVYETDKLPKEFN